MTTVTLRGGAKVRADYVEMKEKFTMKDFKDNEDANDHTENGVKLVNMYGTPAEKKLMAQIAKNHDRRGSIEKKEQELRDKLVKKYYPKFKKWCDEYFYLKHRKETRGAGGIFFDYLDTNNWEKDFDFIKDIGECFLKNYPIIIKNNINKTWTKDDREKLLIKRGRYAEFNLLYDRGTKFGLKTDGNIEAILMSMPPKAKWD